MGVMLGQYVARRDYQSPDKEFVQPTPDPYFIHWLFKHRCVMCTKPASDVNEIVPRARSRDAVLDWRNRVTLCQECHDKFHRDGVTDEKVSEMKRKRREFLISMGRQEYV